MGFFVLSTDFIGKGELLLSSSSEDSPTPKLHIFWSCLKSIICFKIHSLNILLVVSDWFETKLYPTDISGRGFKCGFDIPKQSIFSVRMM